MSKTQYRPTNYGEYVKQELAAKIKEDAIASEWLKDFSLQLERMDNIRDFGEQSANELIIASLAKGFYKPQDPYMQEFMEVFHGGNNV